MIHNFEECCNTLAKWNKMTIERLENLMSLSNFFSESFLSNKCHCFQGSDGIWFSFDCFSQLVQAMHTR